MRFPIGGNRNELITEQEEEEEAVVDVMKHLTYK